MIRIIFIRIDILCNLSSFTVFTSCHDIDNTEAFTGKGLSVIDVMTAGEHGKARKITQDVDPNEYYPNHIGIDFYHRYKEDIALFNEMGIYETTQ